MLRNMYGTGSTLQTTSSKPFCIFFAVCILLFALKSSSSQQPELPSAPSASGSISGTVTDSSGALVRGAQITLVHQNHEHIVGKDRETISDEDGHFAFATVPAGDFRLAVTAVGLSAEIADGKLLPGESLEHPPIVLRIATANTDVNVTLTTTELADIDVHDAEQQRVLGIIPNYYVVYNHTAPPLNTRQKFSLSFHAELDPVTLVLNGVAAGVEQATNSFPGYHQGAAGYGKRFGASMADTASDTILRHAVFATIFRQDPRYFYKGTGSIPSRALYALATAFIAKGDNGHWQPAYASLSGNLASGALSNLYYPPGNRRSGLATVETGLIRTASVGTAHVVQEFLFKYISTGTRNHRNEPTNSKP
jgi:hypothetical protein